MDQHAYDDHSLLVGECKYRAKAAGIQEWNHLMLKAQIIPSKGRELYYLLASKSGFTDEIRSLKDAHVILIDRV